MSSPLVLDCSAAIAWCFDDERDAAALALLERVADFGAVVPHLWPLEVANVLLAAERRSRIPRGAANQALAQLRALPIELDEPNNLQNVWETVTDLARAHGLTIYDAVYLECAMRLALPLATRDRSLSAAARAAGLELVATTE